MKFIQRFFAKADRDAELAFERRRRTIVRRLVQRYSAGNVCLQSGWYTTAEDIQDLRKKVLEHDFRDCHAR